MSRRCAHGPSGDSDHGKVSEWGICSLYIDDHADILPFSVEKIVIINQYENDWLCC